MRACPPAPGATTAGQPSERASAFFLGLPPLLLTMLLRLSARGRRFGFARLALASSDPPRVAREAWKKPNEGNDTSASV